MTTLSSYTEKEYLAFERESGQRHEFYKGNIFTIHGGSFKHNLIEDNLRGHLHNLLKGKNCRSFGINLRLHIPRNTFYTYADALILCGELKLLDDTFDTLLNPSVLIEILSPSTANYDKGTKFELYRDIESLQEYVLINSTKIHVELYQRNHDLSWTLTEYKALTENFELRTISKPMLLADVYEGIQFDQNSSNS